MTIHDLPSLIQRRHRDVGSVGARPSRGRDEDGFVLLESIVAISLITLLMGALATFTINTLTTTTELRARQGAAQLASSTMATVRSIPASDIKSGRDVSSVNIQRSAAPAAVGPYLTNMKMLRDFTAAPGSGATAAVPTTARTQVLNGITYSVNIYLGTCVVIGSTDCERSSGSDDDDDEYDEDGDPFGIDAKVIFTRAVVAVTWRHQKCPASACTYVTSTLINPDVDPVFNTNIGDPPTDPVVTPTDDQVSSVGSPVSLTLAVNSGTGVPTYTWQVTAGALPVGLTLSASGVISGQPTVAGPATPITVTVTDAFGRTGSDTFNWTVHPPPTITTPAAQSSSQGKPITALTPTSTCPNGPCRFALRNAPPGLSINSTTGTVTGSPTTVGTWSNVTITITDDADSTVSTAPFTWQVFPAPDASGLGALTATVGNVKSASLTVNCPTATCTLQLTGTVPGLGLSATTPNSTNNTTTTLTVASGSRTVYVAGQVQPSAVPSGTSQTYSPSVKITDGNGGTDIAVSTWTIYAKPTIGPLGTRSLTETRPENVGLPYTCPNAPCTITLAGTMPGLGLSTTSGATAANSTTSLTVSSTSGTVYVNGTVGTTAVTTGTSRAYTPTVTIRDSSNETGTGTGAWTAYVVPTITNPGTQAIEPNQNLSLQINASCPNGGCTYKAELKLTSAATWTTIAVNTTGQVTHNNIAAGAYSIRVTVTDIDGAATTLTIPLTVQTFSLSIPNQSTSRPVTGTKTATLNVAPLVSPVATGYNYTLSGQPTWLTVSASGVLTATLTPTTAPGSYSVTVNVTSKASSTSTVAATFTWTVT